MAIVHLGDGLYSGLYTDTKPTAPAGYRFFETDTGDTLVSDGTFWWLMGLPAGLSSRRVGIMAMGSTHTAGDGMLNVQTAATGIGAVGHIVSDSNGRYWNYPSGTTTGNKAGNRVNLTANIARHHNPKIRFKFQIPASADHTLARLYLGFRSNTEPTGDDPLNAVSGILVGFISGGTNFIVIRNDGTGTTDVSGDVAGSAQALDTSIHTVSIVADEANSRFGVKWDANAYVFFTTEIPAATTSQTIVYQNETNESGVAKTFRMYSIFCMTEK